jgi:hypothetical protein
LLKSLAALKKFLPGPLSSVTPYTALGLSDKTNPSKYGCFNAYAGVILFWGSKIIIFSIKSTASSLALGISY